MTGQCQNYHAMLSEFIDNELAPELCAELQTHIEQCVHCKKELNLLKLTSHVVKNMPNPAAPPEFLSKLRQRIDAEVVVQPGLWRSATKWLMTHPSLLAASFTVIFISAFVLGRISPAPQIAKSSNEAKVAYKTDAAPAPSAKKEGVALVGTNQPVVAPSARGAGSSAEMEAYRMPRPSSMAMPVSYSTLGASDAPVYTRPAPIQTPTQLIINILRLDPLFQSAKIYPISQGAVAQTETVIYRITISDQNFMNAMNMIMRQGTLPDSMDQAIKAFKLDIEKMPSPLSP